MASRKSKTSGTVQFAQLPSDVRKLARTLTWDPEKMPLLIGVIAGFGESLAKNFNDGKWFAGKKQRHVRIAPDDGDEDIEYVIYEGGQLSALFSLGEGERVAIAFTGTEEVEGFRNPVKRYEVGVY